MYPRAVKLSAALKRPVVLIAIGVIVLVCFAQWQRPAFFERLERTTYDERVRVAARHNPPISTNLGFVDIRNRTIDRVDQGVFGYQYGLYWPRDVYARATRELARQGAKTVAFDVIFAELRPDHKDMNLPDGTKISPDRFFAKIIGKAGNVVLAAEQGAVPADLFRTNAAGMGDIAAEKDALDGGVLRRDRAFRMYRLWHRLFKMAEQNPDFDINLDRADLSHPGKIILPHSKEHKDDKPLEIPLDTQGRFDVTTCVSGTWGLSWRPANWVWTSIRPGSSWTRGASPSQVRTT